MEPTTENRNFMFDGPQNVVKPFMSRVFERLRRPDVDTEFANEYIYALRNQWLRESYMFAGQGFTDLQRISFESGIVETLLQFSQNPRSTTDLAISTYLAMDTFQYFARIANLSQHRKLYDEMMRHNALEIAIDQVENHELCLHRYIGRALIRVLAQFMFLGDSFSPKRTADLCERFCRWTLEGPERDSEELLQPDKTWQSQMMIGRFGTPPRVAATYVKRWYAMSQEFCMFSVYGMLSRSPSPDAKFILSILEFKPELVDMLLKVGMLPRAPWYPESQIDSLAFESLNRLVLFPLSGVPSLPLEGDLKDNYEQECNHTLKSIEIVTSRPNWSTYLINAWMKLEKEVPFAVKRTLSRVGSDYFAVKPPGEEMLHTIFSWRGKIRVSILRLIAASTYASQPKDIDLLSFLYIAYLGSQRFKSQLEIARSGNLEDQYLYAERNEEIATVPFWAMETQTDVEHTAWTPREFITGPIALVRLLTTLASRGLIDRARTMEELPEGVSPSTTIKQVKQILSSEIMLKIISLSKKRVKSVREEGRDCVTTQKDYKKAHLLYLSASELAWNLLELNQSLGGRFDTEVEGVTKELVLFLLVMLPKCVSGAWTTREPSFRLLESTGC
ncbi:hypothetical protein QCA50_012490 [Cerrena zonata]|uniref:Uncharacterized protein n=1 Tax=Cerrena zonata TaxID=2478898 RepID=A0AAW0G3M6_9APHY